MVKKAKQAGDLIKDEKDRKIVYDFLPKKYHQYHYIGRLDYNSEGLLLFTKETSFKRYMELPKSNIKRSYLVNVIGSFDENKILYNSSVCFFYKSTSSYICFAHSRNPNIIIL